MTELLSNFTVHLHSKWSCVSCLWHQTTKTTNLVFPNFIHKVLSSWTVEKENKLFIGPNQVFFLHFGPMKSLFSFSSPQTEKNLWKKLIGENKIRGLVVWCHEQNNIIADSNFGFFLALSFAEGGPGGAELGVPGYWQPQFSTDQLTLFQPGRADSAPTLILAPPDFHTFLRPWTLTTRAGRATLHVVHNDAKKDDLFDKTKLHFFVVFVA
jgi:hypothetical protein